MPTKIFAATLTPKTPPIFIVFVNPHEKALMTLGVMVPRDIAEGATKV